MDDQRMLEMDVKDLEVIRAQREMILRLCAAIEGIRSWRHGEGFVTIDRIERAEAIAAEAREEVGS